MSEQLAIPLAFSFLNTFSFSILFFLIIFVLIFNVLTSNLQLMGNFLFSDSELSELENMKPRNSTLKRQL